MGQLLSVLRDKWTRLNNELDVSLEHQRAGPCATVQQTATCKVTKARAIDSELVYLAARCAAGDEYADKVAATDTNVHRAFNIN